MLHHTTDPVRRAEDTADHEFPRARHWDFMSLRGWLECQEQVLRELVLDDQEAKGGAFHGPI